MAPRREARERALSLGYEAQQRAMPLADLLDELPTRPEEYAVELAEGVAAHHEEIDGMLRRFSDHWSPERMPVIDRELLRLGTYELLHRADVPTAVVITEAVELAKEYSTEDSGRFVNGLLSRIASETRAGV